MPNRYGCRDQSPVRSGYRHSGGSIRHTSSAGRFWRRPYIRYLRSKLDVKGQKSYIKTVRGVGYTMQE